MYTYIHIHRVRFCPTDTGVSNSICEQQRNSKMVQSSEGFFSDLCKIRLVQFDLNILINQAVFSKTGDVKQWTRPIMWSLSWFVVCLLLTSAVCFQMTWDRLFISLRTVYLLASFYKCRSCTAVGSILIFCGVHASSVISKRSLDSYKIHLQV